MSRQKTSLFESSYSRLHLQKQTLTIKNVGLKHQLTLTKDELQGLIIKCKQLSRIKQNLYCLLEKTRLERTQKRAVEEQNQRQNQLSEAIKKHKQYITLKDQNIKQMSQQYETYFSIKDKLIKDFALVNQNIQKTQKQLQFQTVQLKQIKQINFDLQKMRRVLQQEKDNTIQLQFDSKINHEQFQKQYQTIIIRLTNDEVYLKQFLEISKRKCSLMILFNLFEKKKNSYFRQFWLIRQFIISGQRSLKCLDNVAKIVHKNYTLNLRWAFSLWQKRSFNTKKISKLTQQVIVLSTENRLKFKLFSLVESVHNSQQLKLLKQYDKFKYLYQIKLKFLRKDAHVCLTKWWNKLLIIKKQQNSLKLIVKLINQKIKGNSMIKLRNVCVNQLKKQQQICHKQQLSNLNKIVYSFTKIEQLRFNQQQEKIRLYFERHQLFSRAKNQINYHKRIRKTLQIMTSHKQRNQLRSAFYIFYANCLGKQANEKEQQYKIVKKQGDKTNKIFKRTINNKHELRKNLLISFLQRHLSNKQLFYERKLFSMLWKWQKKLAPINSVIKGSLRKHKLGVFTSFINFALVKKYHISPEQIQSLRNKKKQLKSKEQWEINKFQELKRQYKQSVLLRINQLMDQKIISNKSHFFNITTTLQLTYSKSKVMQTSLRIVQLSILRKGFQTLKSCNQEHNINDNHNSKLKQYFFKREKMLKKNIFEEWKNNLKNIEKALASLLSIQQKIYTRRKYQSLSQIKQFHLIKQQNTLSKINFQLQKTILNYKTTCLEVQNEKYSIQEQSKKCLKQFFTNFNKRLNKQIQKESIQNLKSKLRQWNSIVSYLKNRQLKLVSVFRKIDNISKQKAFFCILQQSTKSISNQYKQKILMVRKKDKINELKIQKGDEKFGQQLQKQKLAYVLVLKQLESKQKRFNSLLKGHQQLHEVTKQRKLLKSCWSEWKKIIEINNKVLNIEHVWNLSKRRKYFNLLKLIGNINIEQNRRKKASIKIINIFNNLIQKQSLNKWKKQYKQLKIVNIQKQSKHLSLKVSQQYLKQQCIKQSHIIFIENSKSNILKAKIFSSWKSLSKQQTFINSKGSVFQNQRKQLLIKQTFNQLEQSILFSNKVQLLNKYLLSTSKKKQQKYLNHFNCNIKSIKQLFSILSSKIYRSNIDILSYSFAKIERASQYRHLCYNYQKKKASLKLMKSVTTQSDINKQKLLYLFMGYQQKVHHYLPNILISLQKRLIQNSFYTLRSVAYEDKKLIQRQAQNIMQKQKYEINKQIRQIACQNINGQQLKQYLSKRSEQDLNVIKKVVCRLRLYGNKKLFSKCWNTWTEKIKIKKATLQRLQSIIDLSSPQIKYWNRWKLKNTRKQQVDITVCRKQLINKHEELRKLSVSYKQQLQEMRGEVSNLKFLNDSQQDKLITTSKIALNRLSKCFKKGLSIVLTSWKQKAKKKVNKSIRYDKLSKQIQNLISKREILMSKISDVNASNVQLRQNCKQGGLQAQRLKDLLLEKENLSISLADKKHNIKILLHDNLKIKQKLKQAQDQAMRFMNQFQPLMDRTNYQ